ncbi:Cadherin EGF LAG seven-pass G-type receptor 1 [Holothuria leucospilota]|uniref:Cadherin EGF LAG seven-pass G-type receptor 1 n=1 Tax=Holothuria leucospilota TaxID=206669 RepID=A0A9Q1C143_HOLLE|nr:Cadherin EGF LAG seven-pass G-type receptor 1 [Holothuria leucospilota]
MYENFVSTDIFYNDDNITICGSDHSCKNRCGSWSGTVDCKCDLACKGFGDCCYDFDSYCGNHTVKQRNDRLAFPKKVPAEDYTCFGTVYFRSMFYMVTKCLGSLEDVRNITTSQCENMVLDVDDLLACTPVFDSEGVVYKNVFCALCSDVPISEVTSWSLQIDKDYFKMNGTNRTATSMDSVGRYRFNSDRGKILIEPPETGHIGYPRWCTKYQEPFCKDLLNYTSTFFAPLVKQNIFTGEVFYYHNPLVHKCVFQDITSIRDLCSIMLFNCYDSQTKYDVCLGLSNSRTGDKSTYITLLFDFSNSYSLGMEDVGQSCTKPGEIFDIFLKKCRFLGCPADHKLHDNICEDHQSFAVRTCIMDIGNVQWPYDSVYLYKSPENMFDVFLSANGVLGALFLKIMLQEKLLLESMASSHNLICNVTSFVIGVRTVEEPECRKPSSFLQPFNLPVTYTPFFVYQHQPTLDEVYQETLVTQNCWKRYESDLRCDLANLESEEFEIIDHATILHNASGMLITIDNLKVNMDGTIEVCEDDFSISKNLIVSGTHTVGSVLSVGLLLVTLAIHIGISNLRTLIRICLLNIIAGLLVINVVLFFNDKLSSFLCMICSILSHFAWIYTFTWATNVFSIVVQTWGNKQQLLHMQQKKSKYLALYTVTSWVFPWVVIIASVFLYHCKCIGNLIFRYGEVHFCWISIGEATKFVLGIPIGVLLLLDVLILIMAKLDFSKRNPSSNSRGICGVSPPADYLAAITCKERKVNGKKKEEKEKKEEREEGERKTERTEKRTGEGGTKQLFLSLHGVALIGFLHFLLRNALLELLFPLTLYMESLFIFGAFVPFRKIIKMLQLRVRNYFHRCRADTLENRVYANYNVNDVEQPHMMRRLDNILRK